jgi:hypothetical protein
LGRQPLTPAEFDAACRELVRRMPFLSEVSGHRTPERNAAAGGSEVSKHLLGLARDFVADAGYGLGHAEVTAEALGMWALVHDAGSGEHLHVQAAGIGPLPEWYESKYGGND